MKLIYFDLETSPFLENNLAIQGIGAIYKKYNRFYAFYKTLLDPGRVNGDLLWKYGLSFDDIEASNTKEILGEFVDFIQPEDPEEDVVLVCTNTFENG